MSPQLQEGCTTTGELESQREAVKVAMLRHFLVLTKGRPLGVHQCSCGNHVLLCTPWKRGAGKGGQGDPPHLRREERTEPPSQYISLVQTPMPQHGRACALYKQGRHQNQLRAIPSSSQQDLVPLAEEGRAFIWSQSFVCVTPRNCRRGGFLRLSGKSPPS